jgi:hypothetical protein
VRGNQFRILRDLKGRRSTKTRRSCAAVSPGSSPPSLPGRATLGEMSKHPPRRSLLTWATAIRALMNVFSFTSEASRRYHERRAARADMRHYLHAPFGVWPAAHLLGRSMTGTEGPRYLCAIIFVARHQVRVIPRCLLVHSPPYLVGLRQGWVLIRPYPERRRANIIGCFSAVNLSFSLHIRSERPLRSCGAI